MQIFGVGPLELLLILVLALVIMGPQDMVGTARRLGRWVYNLVRSPTWRAIMETTQEFRDLPQKIVRDAGLDEAMKEIKDTADQVKSEMEATTREINTEMKAATNIINSELNSAATEVNQDIQQATSTSELAAGVAPFASGEVDAEPEPVDTSVISNQAAPTQSLDNLNPDSILWPDLDAESQPDVEASLEAAPVETQPDPYTACLSTFATALGGTMKSPDALELAPLSANPQMITPEMIASAPADLAAVEEPAPAAAEEFTSPAPEASHPWAPGLALSGPAEVDMQARFQAQMAEMEKSFEELDAKIAAQAEAQSAQLAADSEPGSPSDEEAVSALQDRENSASGEPAAQQEAAASASEEPSLAAAPTPESSADEPTGNPSAGSGAPKESE